MTWHKDLPPLSIRGDKNDSDVLLDTIMGEAIENLHAKIEEIVSREMMRGNNAEVYVTMNGKFLFATRYEPFADAPIVKSGIEFGSGHNR